MNQTIEQRLQAVEEAVKQLQSLWGSPQIAGNWLDQIAGSFQNEPAFEEVLALGRAFRESDRPAEMESAPE